MKRRRSAVAAARFEVRYPDAPLGAEINGIDLSHDVDDGDVSRNRTGVSRALVIWFRDQKLTPEQHVRFSRPLRGSRDSDQPPVFAPAQPEIYIVSNIVKKRAQHRQRRRRPGVAHGFVVHESPEPLLAAVRDRGPAR
jgi:alpha-ketoglutarate-dependent taurine dioxygenase